MPRSDHHLATLRDEGDAILGAAREHLGLPVPACPGWTVRDLVSHLGRLFAATAAHVPRGTTERPGRAPAGPGPAADGEAVLTLLSEALAEVLLVLDVVDPELPAWNPWPRTRQVAGLWRRRLALEATVHRFDVEEAIGVDYEIPATLAADGVAEVFEGFLPRARARAKEAGTPLVDGTVHVHLVDVPGEWLIDLNGPDVTVTPGHIKGDAVLRGPASQVLLAVWGRRPLDAPGLDTGGDPALIRAIGPGA